jgi:chromosome segregation ATPase
MAAAPLRTSPLASEQDQAEQAAQAAFEHALSLVGEAAAALTSLVDAREAGDRKLSEYERQMQADRLAWCSKLETIDKVISKWRAKLDEAEGSAAKAKSDLSALEDRCAQAEAREQEALKKLSACQQRALAAEKAAVGYKQLLSTEVARLTRDAQTLRAQFGS